MDNFSSIQSTKAYMNWSGGKDSSLCLHYAYQQKIPVQSLLTSVNKAHNRISMHGVRNELLNRQADSLGLPLHKIELPEQPGMDEYEELMTVKVNQLKQDGFTHAVFGDIFLEDLKRYREEKLETLNIACLFPLWQKNTNELINEFLSLGFKAIIVCVNEKFLDKTFCGRLLDQSFVNDLPPGVDVCGENGEYHSFVFDGPIFKHPIPYVKGEMVYRKYEAPKNTQDRCDPMNQPSMYGFYFCDLLPG